MLLKGKIKLIIVGHVSIQESYLPIFGMPFKRGQNFKLKHAMYKTQIVSIRGGGLEIPIKVLVACDSCKKLSNLVDQTTEQGTVMMNQKIS